MTMCKIICVSDSSNSLAHADVICVYSHYTGVVSEFLDFHRDLTLCLGHSFFMDFAKCERKEGFRKVSAATHQTVVLCYGAL